jgi:cob(I)alamin adenosyltransferase
MRRRRAVLYTRGGDKGETGLYGGKRVPKDSLRVEAYGSIDELNSCIGIAVSVCRLEDVADSLRQVQRLLFIAGADLAAQLPAEESEDRTRRISKADTEWLERETDAVYSKLPRLTGFILPGGSEVSAQIHLARSICRRAERRIVAASRSEKVNPDILPFVNRLSTYLFNLARFANLSEGRSDELWKS